MVTDSNALVCLVVLNVDYYQMELQLVYLGGSIMNEYNVRISKTEHDTVIIKAQSTAEAEAIAYAYAVQGHTDYSQPSVRVQAEMIKEG